LKGAVLTSTGVDPQHGAGNPITAAYPLPRKIEEEKNTAATPLEERRRLHRRKEEYRITPPAPQIRSAWYRN